MKHLKLFAALCCAAMLFAACDKSNEPSNVHEYVDLGLPSGTLWATCNVGADTPEEYGNCYAWGETETKTDYSWETYKFFTTDGGGTFTKYNGTDGKTTLDPEDDAATVNWGGKWRMPTDDEWRELYKNCTWTWTTLNGVNGYEVKSNANGNSIFLPAAGYCNVDGWNKAGRKGIYWSSSLLFGHGSSVSFDSDDVNMSICDRFIGPSVRPVFK